MCGRYYRRSDKQRIAEVFQLGELPDPAHGMSAVEQPVGLARLMDARPVGQLAAIAPATPDGYTAREFMRRRARDIAQIFSPQG
jgi:hypothetical protein